MNWLVVGILSWIALGMERGLKDAFQLGDSAIAPSFIVVLVVYIAAWARRPQALVLGLLIGLAADLLADHSTAPQGDVLTIVGPEAIGMLLAAYTVSIMRAWMLRSSSLAIGVMSIIACAVSGVLGLTLLKMHNMAEALALGPASSELGQRMGTALYSGIVAVPLAMGLNFIRPLLGFSGDGRRG